MMNQCYAHRLTVALLGALLTLGCGTDDTPTQIPGTGLRGDSSDQSGGSNSGSGGKTSGGMSSGGMENGVPEEECDGCRIDGYCVPEGTTSPDNSCQICEPSSDSEDWVDRADGDRCDDGVFCTVGDSCVEGTCEAGPRTPCDDDVACNGAETCNEEAEACVAGTATCAPGQLCSLSTDSCDLTCAGCAIDGVCYANGTRNPLNQCESCDTSASNSEWSTAVDGSACDDGNFCNGSDSCQSGTCSAGVNNPCDDGIACNGAETCDEPSDACLAATSTCAAGTSCNTGADSCDATCAGCLIDGTCYPDGATDPANECQMCDRSADASAWSTQADGASCDDGDFCNGLDSCSAGACSSGGQNPCDDGVDCNGSETCNNDTYSCGAGMSICGAGLTCNASSNACMTTCNGCMIDDTCFPDGVANPVNPCQSCQMTLSTSEWSTVSDGSSCGYNAICGAAICGCDTGWLSSGGFCTTPAVESTDDEWTGSVYVGMAATIPIVNLLVNDKNNVGEDSELVVVMVTDPVNGTVVLDGGNVVFTGSAPGPGSFTYAVQSGDDVSTRFEATVSFVVEAAPTVIANSDSRSVKQGDSVVFTSASLLANDVGSNLTVISVQGAVGGTVSLASGTVSFESTGIAGKPAQFTYTIEDNLGVRSTGTVFMTVTPLDPVSAFVYSDPALLAAKSSAYAPPTTLTIFNAWGRFSNDTFWADGSMATGGAATWTLIADEDGDGNIDGDLDGNGTDDDQTSFLSGGIPINGDVDGDGSFDARFMQTANTNFNGFISPESYSSYTHEVTLWSINSDDDMVGVVIAYENDGASRALYVARTKAGYSPNQGWGLHDGLGNVLVNFAVGSSAGGWSDQATRIKIIRTGDMIQAYATDWIANKANFFSPPAYDPNSLIEIDLSTTVNNITYYSGGVANQASADLTRYQGAHPYGYTNASQSLSSYLDVRFDGGVVDDLLLLLTDKDPAANIYSGSEVWRYSGGTWAISMGESIQTALGFVRTVNNPETSNSYIIRQSEVELQ